MSEFPRYPNKKSTADKVGVGFLVFAGVFAFIAIWVPGIRAESASTAFVLVIIAAGCLGSKTPPGEGSCDS